MTSSERWIIETVLQKLILGNELQNQAWSTVDKVEQVKISVEANRNLKDARDGLQALLEDQDDT